jgi:hypothetical protein
MPVTRAAADPLMPARVEQCLNTPKTAGLAVLTANNPFYLRGDFDGDSKPDYALSVRSKNGGTGVVICAGSGSLFLLGAGVTDGGAPFSDMEQDRFLAPHWFVYTQQDVAELKRFRSNVPRPVPLAKGEAIAMVWEDGISLIFWDGTAFRWAGSKE